VTLSMEKSLKNNKATLVGACLHEDCDPFARIYVKSPNLKLTRVPTQRVPYCVHCGSVKNVSSDKAKLVGWYTNLLHIINHNICLQFGKLTQAQQRLIISEIEKVHDFEDHYQMTKSAQLDIFLVAFHKIRPDIPFFALEQAINPEKPKKQSKDEVRALPAWVQYLEWLKKKRAKDAAANAAGAGAKK